jgi:hypothetical protein
VHNMIKVVTSGNADRGLICVPGCTAFFHRVGPWCSVGPRLFRNGWCQRVLAGAVPCRPEWIIKWGTGWVTFHGWPGWWLSVI